MRQRVIAVVLTGFGILLVLAANMVSNGNTGAAALAPVAVVTLVSISVVPLRHTLLSLIFLGLALDTHSDAGGLWQSPLAPLGTLLTENLNKTIPVASLRVSVFAILLGYLLLLHTVRMLTCVRQTPTPSQPMITGFGVSLVTIVALAVYGLARGGDVQMMNLQVQNFVLMILLAYLVGSTFAGVRDQRLLARLIVAGACVKALVALWVWHVLLPEQFAKIEVGTNHGDSVLFSSSVAFLAVLLVSRRGWHRAGLPLTALLVILAGVAVNSRRLAWVEVTLVIVTLYVLTPWTRGKLNFTRAVLLASPLVVAYFAVGWNSHRRIFAPVQFVRSVQDEDVDRSTLDRDVENFNLVATSTARPLFGSGLGQPYAEVLKGDDISKAFSAYRYVPHNSVLWLITVGGILGIPFVWAGPLSALLVASRHYFRTTSTDDRVSAFLVIATVQIYMLQCWGDMGFIDIRGVFVVGPILGLAAQLRAPGVQHAAPTIAIAA